MTADTGKWLARPGVSKNGYRQEHRPDVMLNVTSVLDFVPKTSTPQNTLSLCVH